jgi:DUF4097 and DUF4098 domain-containing protein YvlB
MNTKNLITMLAALTLATGCADTAISETHEIEADIERVEINVQVGDLMIKAGEARRASIDVLIDCRCAAPEHTVHMDGTTLRVELDAAGAAGACTARFELIVPADVTVDLKTWAGNVELQGLRGDAAITTYDGDIDLDDITGALELNAVAGHVTGTRLDAATCTARTGHGDIALGFTAMPGQVDARVILGNATLTVPAEAYRIGAEARQGTVTLDQVTHDAAAATTLQATTDAGDIAILGE